MCVCVRVCVREEGTRKVMLNGEENAVLNCFIYSCIYGEIIKNEQDGNGTTHFQFSLCVIFSRSSCNEPETEIAAERSDGLTGQVYVG